jgi:hypothetical protein
VGLVGLEPTTSSLSGKPGQDSRPAETPLSAGGRAYRYPHAADVLRGATRASAAFLRPHRRRRRARHGDSSWRPDTLALSQPGVSGRVLRVENVLGMDIDVLAASAAPGAPVRSGGRQGHRRHCFAFGGRQPRTPGLISTRTRATRASLGRGPSRRHLWPELAWRRLTLGGTGSLWGPCTYRAEGEVPPSPTDAPSMSRRPRARSWAFGPKKLREGRGHERRQRLDPPLPRLLPSSRRMTSSVMSPPLRLLIRTPR